MSVLLKDKDPLVQLALEQAGDLFKIYYVEASHRLDGMGNSVRKVIFFIPLTGKAPVVVNNLIHAYGAKLTRNKKMVICWHPNEFIKYFEDWLKKVYGFTGHVDIEEVW